MIPALLFRPSASSGGWAALLRPAADDRRRGSDRLRLSLWVRLPGGDLSGRFSFGATAAAAPACGDLAARRRSAASLSALLRGTAAACPKTCAAAPGPDELPPMICPAAVPAASLGDLCRGPAAPKI